MDMPISQINTRLFAQLPVDTGLGLLFAVGTVGQVIYASGGRPIQFTLRQAGYALRCKVSPSVELDFELTEGQQVRATGFLNFSSQAAQYHLICRDLELAKETPRAEGESEAVVEETVSLDEEHLSPDWLLGIQKRAQVAPEQVTLAEIPDWVKALAPPEAQTPEVEGANVLWGRQRVEAALKPPVELEVPEPPRLDEDEELLDYLLEALERSEHEDVELTADLFAQFRGQPADDQPEQLFESSNGPVGRPTAFDEEAEPEYEPSDNVERDRWILLVGFFLFVLTIAVVAFLVGN